MSKKLLIGITTFALMGVASIAYLRIQSDDMLKQPNISTAQNSTNPQPAQNTTSTGQYVDYSPDIIGTSSGQKILFFHAPWCAQCRSIEKGILEQGVPGGYTIIKVDYDSNQELRKKYGVTLQTTFVKVDDQGSLQAKYVAYDEPTFDAVKQNFL
jgi:thiol-disulfide isomerase/thioredoxin